MPSRVQGSRLIYIAATILCAILGVGCPQSPGGGPGYVGTNTCLGCHDGISSPDVQDYRQNIHYAEGVGCEDCHGPGAAHVKNLGRLGLFITNPRSGTFDASYGTCAGCHADTVGQFLQSEHAIQQVATCYDCHEFHRADSWYLPFRDNRICLSCHGATDFPDDAAIEAHTMHPNAPTEGPSQCVGCHMQPLQRENQQKGHFNHSLKPVQPRFTAAAIEAGILPAPANTCAGITGCHDGSIEDAPFFNPDSIPSNNRLQDIYEDWYGENDAINFALILHLITGQT